MLILSAVLITLTLYGARGWLTASAESLSSWNPNVQCAPSQVTVRDILGASYPQQSLAGSPWQTSSTSGGIPNKRALSPPCTITNINGQVVSAFVQLNGVYLASYKTEVDCNTRYNTVNGGGPFPDRNGNGSPDTICDSVGNIYTMGASSGYVHIEIDMDWMAAGYCGPSTFCDNRTLAQYVSSGSVSLDMQGFVYWDPELSGHWELHPLTAWKLSSDPTPSPGLSTSFTYSPTGPTPDASVSFSEITSGGSPPYTFSWSFGDRATSVEQNPENAFAQEGVYQTQLTVTDSDGVSSSASDTVIVIRGTSASWSPNVACTALVMTLEQVRVISNSNPGVANLRQLNQPCTVTGRQGMEFGVLVQINGVLRGALSENDWSTTFASVNGGGPYPNGLQSDTAFTIYNPAYANSCMSASDQNCYHRVFTEIDRDWKSAGYCGPSTVCDNSTLKMQTTTGSTLIDVQGFLHLNSQYANATWHSLTPWDLHTITAWRVSQPDFEVTASTESMTMRVGQSGTASINVTSLYRFSDDVTFSAEVVPTDTTGSLSPSNPTAEFNPQTVSIAASGTGTSILTVSSRLLTLPGTYTVSVTATSGSLSHTTTITVTAVLL